METTTTQGRLGLGPSMVGWLALSNATFGLWYVAAVVVGLWASLAAAAVVGAAARLGTILASRRQPATVLDLPFFVSAPMAVDVDGVDAVAA